ncbi:MAG TPA: dockerin type I domain-containing protein [Gemmataceae bacterium]|jgi:hypothetical protein|nr:dockerin type I domain-containing protein [Gemmataceae bacterium]
MSVLTRSSAVRRRKVLRIDTLEDRDVPSSAIGQNFNGGNINDSGYIPPDTDGAVGPNHYVQFINGVYRVFNKTGTQLQTKTDSAFWQSVSGIGSGVVPTGDASDPRIIYDPLTDRWIASEITVDNTNEILLARSNTNDPTGAWKGVHWQADLDGNFGDYDTLAVDANGVYLGTNDFGAVSQVSVSVNSIPKADLMASTPTAANRTQFQLPGFDVGYTPAGVTNFNPSPAHSSVFAEDASNFGQVVRTILTGTGGPGAGLGTSTTLNVQNWGPLDFSNQPDGAAADVDPVDDRFGGMVYQVGDLIIGAHAVGVGGNNAIRITVMSDSQNAVVAEATISGGGFDRIDPSVAMNAEGDILIGYSRSSATLGSGPTSGRLGAYATTAFINPRNPAGGISFGTTDMQLQIGLASNYHVTFGGGSVRWGDYSATQVDPTNATAFWTTQEYVLTSNNWGTKISQVFVSPRVTLAGVTSTLADGTYTTGQVIPITVTFNDKVTVAGGTPSIALNAGGGATATYVSGSGTNVLTFNYTVALGQGAADLDYTAAGIALNGATIKDTASTLDAILTLVAPGATGSLGGNKNIVIDTTPRVTAVTSPSADGTYGVGAVIPITLTFGSSVTVTGSPQLALNAGGGAVATYASGSPGTTLTFNYTVATGQASADLDYSSTSALTLNGGTIKDSSNGSINANLTLPATGSAASLGGTKAIVIDTTAPAVTNVTSAVANTTYGFAAVIPITMTFSKKVTVTGIPQLALDSGATVNYASGSGTTTLTFNYTVAVNEFSADLNYISTAALTLPGGAIIKEMGTSNDADTTLPDPAGAGSLGANKDIVIDSFPAKVTDVSSSLANLTYPFGQVVPIQVTFDKKVDVTGVPVLALNTGGSASYTGGTGTKILTFSFTVGLTDFSADLDYTVAGISLPGGATIKDNANPGANATLTLAAPGTAGSLGFNKDIVIDGLPATPTNVTSVSSNGTYGIGAVIPITVAFSKQVTVTGSPKLLLNSGGTAVYTGGNGTFSSLIFSYTVVVGENTPDLDAASGSALVLNGGTIQDTASNTPAPLTMPVGATVGSLATNKNLVIDTVGPNVVEFRVKFGTKWYNLIGSPRFDMPWAVTGIQVVFDDVVKTGNKNSLTGLTATKFTGLGTNILTWKVPTILKTSVLLGLASSGANALKDAAGNAMTPFATTLNVLYGDVNDDHLVNAADEAAVRAVVAAPFVTGSPNYNIFADLSGDGFVNVFDVGVAHKRRGNTLP